MFDIYNDTYILQEGPKIGMLPGWVEKEKNLGKRQRSNFRKAYLAGATMAFGTDGGVYPHGDNARQFATMVEWGAKPIDAIRMATVNAAWLLNLEGKVGVLKAGAFADMIAVSGDPRANVEELQRVELVVKDGTVF